MLNGRWRLSRSTSVLPSHGKEESRIRSSIPLQVLFFLLPLLITSKGKKQTKEDSLTLLSQSSSALISQLPVKFPVQGCGRWYFPKMATPVSFPSLVCAFHNVTLTLVVERWVCVPSLEARQIFLTGGCKSGAAQLRSKVVQGKSASIWLSLRIRACRPLSQHRSLVTRKPPC